MWSGGGFWWKGNIQSLRTCTRTCLQRGGEAREMPFVQSCMKLTPKLCNQKISFNRETPICSNGSTVLTVHILNINWNAEVCNFVGLCLKLIQHVYRSIKIQIPFTPNLPMHWWIHMATRMSSLNHFCISLSSVYVLIGHQSKIKNTSAATLKILFTVQFETVQQK